MKSNQRAEAIAYATRTTGTVLWCTVGVYSGDGMKGLDSVRMGGTVPQATRDFVAKHCVRFTAEEVREARARAEWQLARSNRLAKLAIDAGKYAAAVKLCHLSEAIAWRLEEFAKGTRVMFRIKGQ